MWLQLIFVKNFKQLLQLHQEVSPKLRGIRKMASFHADKGIHAWTDEPHLYCNKKFLKGFEELAKANLSFDAWVYSTQISDVAHLAKTFPETPIVLDHLGTPAGIFGKVGKATGQTAQQRDYIFRPGKKTWLNWQNAQMCIAKSPVCLCLYSVTVFI